MNPLSGPLTGFTCLVRIGDGGALKVFCVPGPATARSPPLLDQYESNRDAFSVRKGRIELAVYARRPAFRQSI